jgi:uncharacterized protein (DUF934 family)
MSIIKDDQLIENAWTFFEDDAIIDSGKRHVLVSLQRWQQEKNALLALTCQLGLRLVASDNLFTVVNDLHSFVLIELYFSTFTDGRSFSQAYLLRHRYKFEGEIRAAGHYLVDQGFYLSQIGVNAFEIANQPQSDVRMKAALKDFTGQSLWADLRRKFKKIIKHQEIIEDDWHYVADNAPNYEHDYIIVSLMCWQQNKATLCQREKHIGIRLLASDDLIALKEDLHNLPLIELYVTDFADGRTFSQAFLLRHRYHYSGEIRVAGAFVPDQAAYLARIGVDSFNHEHLLQTQATLNDFSFHYQTA